MPKSALLLREPVAHGCGEYGNDERVDARTFGLRGFLDFCVELGGEAKQSLLRLAHIAHDSRDCDMLRDIRNRGGAATNSPPPATGGRS